MKITLTQRHAPLAPFEWELAPLTVLVGPNGSGKSRLLEGLASSLKTSPRGAKSFLVDAPVRDQDVVHRRAAWQLQRSAPVSPQYYVERVDKLVQHYSQSKTQAQTPKTPDWRILEEVAKRAGLDLGTAHEDEVRRAITHSDVVTRAIDVTADQIAQWFLLWELRRRDALVGVGDPPAGPAPWEIFQRILDRSGLPYTVSTPAKLQSIHRYQLNLSSTKGEVIELSALSSGEQVIFGMGTWLFGADESLGKPKLLLLDEPDAHLHPAMTKRFLATLEDVLVNEHGVGVVLTTHSPTTVALVRSEASIFSLVSTADGFIPQRASRDQALGTLLVGVPSLRVDRANTRQVFVESAMDEDVLTALQGCLQQHLDPEVSLHFVASGAKKDRDTGNCTRVIHLVERLVDAGNTTVRGLIDWDRSATATTHVHVLCSNVRYAIENVVLDPLGIAALLLRHRLVKSEQLGLPRELQWRAFMTSDLQTWQCAVDGVSVAIRGSIRQQAGQDANEMVNVEYVGGRMLQVPKLLLVLRGHDLETAVTTAFPCVGEISKGQEDRLLRKMCELVYADAPELICKDLLNSLLALQKR
jgi:predicted ATPase